MHHVRVCQGGCAGTGPLRTEYHLVVILNADDEIIARKIADLPGKRRTLYSLTNDEMQNCQWLKPLLSGRDGIKARAL